MTERSREQSTAVSESQRANVLAKFVSAMSQVDGVNRIVKVGGIGVPERIFVLTPEDDSHLQLTEVAISWSDVLEELRADIDTLNKLGPVWCEGQFEEYIETAIFEPDQKPEISVLWEKPQQAA